MDPQKERAERVLAGAIAIDGRKDWICKFCSGSNVWTRRRCRRCFYNIPAGLRGKYRQAVAAKCGEGSTGSSISSGDKKDAEIEELRAQIEYYRKQRGGEEQGGQGLPPRRESGVEEVWGIDAEDEIESRKKLDEQRKKVVALKNSRVCRKSFRTASGMTCSSICGRWSKGGMTSCQSIRKCRKITKDTKHPGQMKDYPSTRGDAENQRGNRSK